MRGFSISPWLVSAALFLSVGGSADVSAANLSLTFDRDPIGQAPKEGVSTGSVRVVQHPMRTDGDLSVALAWDQAKDRPEFTLTPADRKLPLRGVLRFDLLINRRGGGALEVVGLTNRERTMFRFTIDRDGRAWTVGADDVRKEILCVAAPPDLDHWYNVCLTYDLAARLFSVVLDSYWKSGDTAAATIISEESLDRLVFRGQGEGPSAYCLDSVRLLAVEADTVGSDGSTLPLGCYARRIQWETPLLADSGPRSAVIVYPSGMAGGAAMGETLRQAVHQRSGKDIPCVGDQVVTDPASWLVREEFLGRPIIALGNATDSKVLYALATRFLTQSNRKWPGEGKFCVRSVLEPFRADVNWIIVEASTPEGLGAGVQTLAKRIAMAPAANLAVAYFRELGAATGQWVETPFQVQGLDLSRPIEEIKEQIKTKYGPSARIAPGDLYYGDAWTWLAGAGNEAAKFAAGVLLMQLERDPYFLLVGHYNYDQCIKAWQICFTSGVVNEALINRAEAAMARTAANPAYAPNDWFVDTIRSDRGRVMASFTGRHWIATTANFICGSDYVLGHCRLNPITRALVEDYQQAFVTSAQRLTDTFRPRVETAEIGDCNAMILNLMAITGNLTYVGHGTLARAAEFYLALNNNLGCFVAEGAYIGSSLGAYLPGKVVIGAAAFYTGDEEFQWLWNHFPGTWWSCTAQTNSVFDDQRPERLPQRYVGLHVLPFDPNNYRTLALPGVLPAEWRTSVTRPLTQPIETLYETATFRDGFGPADAFLTLYGAQTSHVMLANTIPQYTDLGQVLLFTSTQFQDRWCRNAGLASNGLPCQPAAACVRKATVASPAVSAISSVDPFSGNTEGARTIVHRAGHYFVVFDTFRALADDEYTFAVRWRSTYPASLEGPTWKELAPQGVRFQITPADAVRQESAQEDFDGEYRPFVLTQHRQARLQTGQAVCLRSLLYAASDARPDECEIRPAGDNCVLVHGRGKDWDEVALIGLGASPAGWPEIEIKADVFYVSGEDLVAANATCVRTGGKSLAESAAPANVVLKIREQGLGPVLAKALAAAPAPGAQAPPPAREYGIRSRWQSSAPAHAPESFRVASATADRPSWSFATVDKIVDPNRVIHTVVPHNGISWKSAAGPVKLTLDLGAVKNVAAVRLIGTVANGYVRKYSWSEGDLGVAIAFSDDNFQNDTREVQAPAAIFSELNLPRVHYVWAARLPQLTIRTAARTRYIRLTISSRLEDVPLQKVIVEGQEPQPTLFCELKAADLDGDGDDELLVKTANGELLALGADGTTRWSQRFGGEIVSWDVQDLETDRRAEVLAYTSEDACYVLNGDGTQRWKQDFYEYSKQGPEEKWQRWYCTYLFTQITAWRPDAAGRKEVIGWPKGPPPTAIRAEGNELKLIEYKDLGYAQSGVADSQVLGREVMVMCGSQLLVKDTQGKTIVSRNMRGPLAGNGDFPVFVAAAAVAEGHLKGFLGLNPASVEWAPADPNDSGWGQFSEVPITAYLLKDTDGDGVPELLLGGKDGFVRLYRLSDGKIVGKGCAGSPVTGLAALGADIVVATRHGVRAYNSSLEEKGSLAIRAVSVATLRGRTPVVCVADEAGVIRALGL